MRRDVTAWLELTVTEPAVLVLQIAVAVPAREQLTLHLDGVPLPAPREYATGYGGRSHVLDCAPGALTVSYQATVDGRWTCTPPPVAAELERLALLRPSRYCPSDTLQATAAREFAGLPPGSPRIAAVTEWVRNRLSYVGGSSKPTDDAVDTLLAGEGVCRDYAHLVAALLRALDVPARITAVYPPGLSLMDFHAVVEAWDGERWLVVDATGLAPRSTMIRICTGRDAADTAFLSSHHGSTELTALWVTATADELPAEDPDEPLAMG